MITKRFALLSTLFLLFAQGLNAQTVNTLTTIAGGGSPIGDGITASSATLSYPQGIAVDGMGNMFIADRNNYRIRKISSSGEMTTIAGSGSSSTSGGDGGLATAASFKSPTDIVADAQGNLYITDEAAHRIRKITGTTGIITTIGGDGTGRYSNTGKGQFSDPKGLAVDGAGNVYVADAGNHRVRKITPAGLISTLAGMGTNGYSGDGSAATNAQLSYPNSLAVDASGNIYVADLSNHRIRKITVATGIISTIAGNGTPGFGGDGGQATAAQLDAPYSIAIDAANSLYISDLTGYRIRKVNLSTGIIISVAGNGTKGASGNGGAALSATLAPTGIALDASGNMYISNTDYHQIRKVAAATGIISLYAGYNPGLSTTPPIFTGAGSPATSVYLSNITKPVRRSNGDIFFGARINKSTLMSFWSGGSLREYFSLIIGKISSSGVFSIYAGDTTGTIYAGDTTGIGSYPNNYQPAIQTKLPIGGGIAMDIAGNIYFSGHQRIHKIDAATGIIKTFLGNGIAGYSNTGIGQVNSPSGVAVDGAGNVYVADAGNHCIRKITASNGVITTIAGTGTAGFSGDGSAATGANLSQPIDIAVDAAGNIYIADYNNDRIRKITASTGIITTVAGGGSNYNYGTASIPATTAVLHSPKSISTDAVGNIYVACKFQESYICKIDASTNMLQRVVCKSHFTSQQLTSDDGTNALETSLSKIPQIFADASGLYIADDNRLRKLIPATGPTITTGYDTAFSSCRDSIANAVPYYTTGTFNTGNVFTLQVSDAIGSFANPIAVGSVASTASGTIQAAFPTNLVPGSSYKMRVVSSNPAFNGASTFNIFRFPRVEVPTLRAYVSDTARICSGASLLLAADTLLLPGAFYQWYKNGSEIYSTNSSSYASYEAGTYHFTAVTDRNSGCAVQSLPATVIIRPLPATPTISPSATQNICAGSSVILTRNNVTGLTYQWMGGSSLNTTVISGATGTTYIAAPTAVTEYFRVVATNADGCSKSSGNVRINLKPTSDTTVTASGPTTFCSGSSVTLSVPVITGNTYAWKNNGIAISGATNNTFTATVSGNYTALVSSSSGCTATSSPIAVTANNCAPTITSVSPAGSYCPGSPVTISFAGTGNYTSGNVFTAQLSDASGSFASPTSIGTLNGVTPGTIVATIGATQTSGTQYRIRIVSSSPAQTGADNGSDLQIGAAPTAAQSTISLAGPSSICPGTLVGMSFRSASGYSYQWYLGGVPIAGATSRILRVIPMVTSVYTGIVTNMASGCTTTSDPKTVTMKPQPPIQDICAATMDSAAGKIRLVWNKQLSGNEDSFVFYRQNNVATYSRVGAQAITAFSSWIDAGSTPNNKAHRYYITAKNACNESPAGTPHKTLHVTLNKGINDSTWNLIWNDYEGAPHTYYNVYRGTTLSTMNLIGTVAADDYNSYTDNSAPANGPVYYRVATADAPSCTPNRSADGSSGATEAIMSNIVSTGRSALRASWVDMTVYPNPSTTTGVLRVESSDPQAVFTIRITDVSGRVLQSLQTAAGREVTFGEALTPGLYMVEAIGEGGKHIVKKWTKQ